MTDKEWESINEIYKKEFPENKLLNAQDGSFTGHFIFI